MNAPHAQLILKIMELLDWGGHVELPINDMQWLAEQLAGALQPRKHRQCDVCGDLKPIVIEIGNVGRICEDCLQDASEEAEQVREDLEST